MMFRRLLVDVSVRRRPSFVARSVIGGDRATRSFCNAKDANKKLLEITKHVSSGGKESGIHSGPEGEIAHMQSHMQDLIRRGDVEEGMRVGKECLKTVETYVGKEHPVYASVLNNIGMVNKNAGNYNEALEYFSDAIGMYKRIVGDTHTNTLVAMSNLGQTYKTMAQNGKAMQKLMFLENARELFEQVLDGQRENFGPDHPEVGVTMQNLGAVYRYMGKKDKSLEYVKGGYEVIHKAYLEDDEFGGRHERVATALNNLGLEHKQAGRFDEAVEFYSKSLEMRVDISGPDHEQSILVMHNLAELYMSKGDEKKATEIHNEILDILGYVEDDEAGQENFFDENDKEFNLQPSKKY